MPDSVRLNPNRLLLVILPLLLVIGAGAFVLYGRQEANPLVQQLPDSVDYNYHIRPILSDRCYKCHGPDASKREANLRLDTEEGAYAALKADPTAHVVVPGDPLRSELYL